MSPSLNVTHTCTLSSHCCPQMSSLVQKQEEGRGLHGGEKDEVRPRIKEKKETVAMFVSCSALVDF